MVKKLSKTEEKILEEIKKRGCYTFVAGLITSSYLNAHGKKYKVGVRDEKATIRLSELGLVEYEVYRHLASREYSVKLIKKVSEENTSKCL